MVTGVDYLHQALRLRRTSARAVRKRAERAERAAAARRASQRLVSPTGARRVRPRRAVVALLRELDLSVGTAESLTGGLVCGALTSVPGASTVVRGGVVAYASEVKADVLGVDRDAAGPRGRGRASPSPPSWPTASAGVLGCAVGRVDDRGRRPRPGRRAAGRAPCSWA